MAKRMVIFLLSSFTLIQSISGQDCPSTCDTACDVDKGCSTCKAGYFGRKCQYPLQCYTGRGLDYHGTVSITENGLTCQTWKSQSPNAHGNTHFPVNYCRNLAKSNDQKPWCYNGEGKSPRYEDCNVPSCDAQCPVPSLYVFGDITNPPSTGFQVGVTVTILTGCGPGSIGNRTCQSDKTWSDAFDCTSILWCPRPTANPKSSINNNDQNEYYFDKELEVSCVNGYEIAGSTNKIKCQGDKSWGTIPDCTIVQCVPPVLRDNRVIASPQGPYEYEDTITIGCETGYTVSGQNTLKCEANKSWSGTMPTCNPVPCPDLTPNLHSSINSGKISSFVFGDKVTFVCSKGYTVKGQVTLKCQSNAKWNGQPPTCEPVPCPKPEPPTNALIVDPTTNYVFSDKIQFKCDKGFAIDGDSEITCQADGSWTKIPLCTVIKCQEPTLSTNGIITEGNKTEYVYGNSVGVNCSTGFTHQGNNTMTCYDNGLWVGTDWQCIAVKCPNPAKPDNGVITEGAKTGYVYQDSLVISCSSGYSLQGNNTMTCHHTGEWVGTNWQCTADPNPGGPGGNVGAAAGGAIGGVVAVVVVVVIIVIILRRRRQKPADKYTSHAVNNDGNVYANSGFGEMMASNDTAKIEENDVMEKVMDDDETPKVEDDNTYYNISNVPQKQADTKRRISDLVIEDKDATLFAAQFSMLKSGLQRETNEACKPMNRNKNKYKSIYAYDDNRIKLRVAEGKSNYINASPIQDYNGKSSYVASQGPIKTSLNDFWQMILELKSGKIVMLTNVFEESRKKCEQYWPDEDTVQYGDITVKLCDEEVFADFTIRQLGVTDKEGVDRYVTQYHFTAWPDKSVPKYASSLVQFRRKVCGNRTREQGPMVVHCSAGIGRTGTFIALNYLVDEFTKTGFVDVYSCVDALRQQRVNMVQTKEQFAFLYGAVIEEYQCQQSTISSSEFASKFQNLLKVNPKTKVPYIDEEYQRLNVRSPMFNDEEGMEGMKTVHRRKNRHENILPVDAYRPHIVGDGRENGSYINAAYLPGYKDNKAYLSTQMPLPGTMTDFWTLIMEQNITSILMLNTGMDKTCGQYWPEDGKTKTFGQFTVTSSETTETDALLIKEMEVKSSENKLIVKQFRLMDWPETDSVPSSPSLFLEIMDVILAWQIGKPAAPVLIHCLDGAKKTGLFCTVMAIIDRLKIEQDVTIPQVVKQMRSRRPQVIVDKRQHRYCYEAVSSYLQGFETYSNFI